LDAELVAKGLLTRTELIDAIAVGHHAGTRFFSVTFVGHQINGTGALISTLAIFLPFVFCGTIELFSKKNETLKLLLYF
jgi:chromate transporter